MPLKKRIETVQVHPMEDLEIGSGKFDTDFWYLVEMDGARGYTNGRLACRGPWPEWAKEPRENKNLAGALAKIEGVNKKVACHPVAVVVDREKRDAVWFDGESWHALQTRYYEHVVLRWPTVRWETTVPDGACFAYVEEDLVAVVMHLRTEELLKSYGLSQDELQDRIRALLGIGEEK